MNQIRSERLSSVRLWSGLSGNGQGKKRLPAFGSSKIASRKPKAGRLLIHILDVGGDPPLISEVVGYGAHAVSVRLFRRLFH